MGPPLSDARLLALAHHLVNAASGKGPAMPNNHQYEAVIGLKSTST